MSPILQMRKLRPRLGLTHRATAHSHTWPCSHLVGGQGFQRPSEGPWPDSQMPGASCPWGPSLLNLPVLLLLLLLLLSRFSRVRLCATPETASHQAPPSLGFSRQKQLEWVAISFSNAWKWKVKVKSLSCVPLFSTPWTAAYQAPPSMEFSRQEYWSRLPSPSLSNLLVWIITSKYAEVLGLWAFIGFLP